MRQYTDDAIQRCSTVFPLLNDKLYRRQSLQCGGCLNGVPGETLHHKYPFNPWVGRGKGDKVSCPRTHCNGPAGLETSNPRIANPLSTLTNRSPSSECPFGYLLGRP